VAIASRMAIGSIPNTNAEHRVCQNDAQNPVDPGIPDRRPSGVRHCARRQS
jgi:hypothetical protein